MAYVRDKYKKNWGSKGPYLDKDVAIKVVPAPIKGWDALSPKAAMEPQYATDLVNWVPRTGYVEVRGGYNAWAQGLSTLPVNSLMCYRPSGSSEKLFAASSSSIFDVSSYGVYTTQLTGLTSDKWQHVNFTPAGGANYLLCVNGSDSYRAYNGTAWSTPSITGVTSSNLVHINIFKRRVWFIQNNSTSAWFLATDAISGAATQFDLGALMSKGGYLVAMATWTLDGGAGPDDYAVFITSKGQYIVYKGTDPTVAAAWALVGVFDLAPPIGRRCVLRYGAETLVITTQGLIPLSQALPFDPAASRSTALTNRIQNAMLQAAQLYSSNFGWQTIAFSQQGLLIMNVPQVDSSTQVQFVMNLLTGAWCQFQGWNACCFEIFNESLYFGGTAGSVNLAYTGGVDFISPISYYMGCAYNYLDEPGRLKNANLIRPFIVADGTLTPYVAIDVDFNEVDITAPVVSLTPAGGVWDTALWDSSSWSSGTVTVTNWLSCNALGTALSINLLVNLGTSVATSNTSVFDTGVFDTMVFDGNGNITASGLNVPTLQVNVFELGIEYGGPV